MKWSAATQAGTLVQILGEVDMKGEISQRPSRIHSVSSCRRTGNPCALQEGRQEARHSCGRPPCRFPGRTSSHCGLNREWVEENTADMREEVQASMSKLKEIDKIVGPALDKNKKLPK